MPSYHDETNMLESDASLITWFHLVSPTYFHISVRNITRKSYIAEKELIVACLLHWERNDLRKHAWCLRSGGSRIFEDSQLSMAGGEIDQLFYLTNTVASYFARFPDKGGTSPGKLLCPYRYSPPSL